MNDLPLTVVNDLIALGGLGDSPSAERDQLLARLKPYNRVDCLGWDHWNPAADMLAEPELRNLTQGLIRAELELRWRGGSVAGVIWVFRRYESRFPERAEGLADWVLARSENPYAPFGRRRGGARSLAEFQSFLRAKARRLDESVREQEDARQDKRIRAVVRGRLDHERRVFQAARSRARAELNRELQALPMKERLEHIAWDDIHSLSFFPASFAEVDERTWERLDTGTRKRLVSKMAARRKGAWKRIYDKLATHDEPPQC